MMASKRMGAYKVPFKEVSSENQPTSNSQTVISETSINQNIESDKIKSLVQKKSLKRKKTKTRGSPEMQNNVKVGNITEGNGTETQIKHSSKFFEPKQIETYECHVTKQDIWDTLQTLLHEVVKQVSEDKLTDPLQNIILTDFKMKAPSSFSVVFKNETSLCHPTVMDTLNETGCFDSEIQISEGTGNLQCTFKTLSILSMNALDLEKENQLREEYSFNGISKQETLKKNGGNETAQNKTNMLQDDTEDSFYEKFVPITKLCTEHETKRIIGTSLDPDIHANMSNSFSNAPSKMHLFTEKEILKLEDKVEKKDTKHAKRSCEDVSNRENKKTNKENISPSETKHSLDIFDQEDLITENILLRERGENEDIIPTGIFPPLNEIFKYNQKGELLELKLETQDISSNKNIIVEKLKGKTSKTNSSSLTGTNSIHELMDNSDQMNTEENKESNITYIAVDDKQEPHKEEYKSKSENIHSKGDTAITKKNTRYNELSKVEANNVEENNLSDIGSFMEMDDDFNLTASQLSMLEADEKMEIENYSNGKCSTGQQTDIGGNQLLNEQEILNQLLYLRCCIEYIKERIDK